MEITSLAKHDQQFVVDYVIYFRKSNGSQAPKVFKGTGSLYARERPGVSGAPIASGKSRRAGIMRGPTASISGSTGETWMSRCSILRCDSYGTDGLAV